MHEPIAPPKPAEPQEGEEAPAAEGEEAPPPIPPTFHQLWLGIDPNAVEAPAEPEAPAEGEEEAPPAPAEPAAEPEPPATKKEIIARSKEFMKYITNLVEDEETKAKLMARRVASEKAAARERIAVSDGLPPAAPQSAPQPVRLLFTSQSAPTAGTKAGCKPGLLLQQTEYVFLGKV